jgi:SAM-dependent methyltransferase
MQGLPGRAIQGSMLDCPLPNASVDCVVSIGCFHHTGSVARCIEETRRVLRPGGEAYFMVYNALSYRQWLRWPMRTLRAALNVSGDEANEARRKAYDANSAGVAAPETVFTSRSQLSEMLQGFSQIEAVLENCDHLTLHGRTLVSRDALLSTLGRLAGLDIYVRAIK